MRTLSTSFSIILCLIFGSACGSLTFENEGYVNFERYKSVYVLPVKIEGAFIFNDLDAATDAYDYLVMDLEASSGFKNVYTTLGSHADTELSVWLSVREDYDYEADLITYLVETEYLLTNHEGVELYSGYTSEYDEDLQSAINETLSEVSHFFIQPYRI